jgi:S-adenosylmethionine hydrolase
MGGTTFEVYERISSLNKISINNLECKREEMENIISKLDVVEKAVNNINQDILCENKFDRVKNFVIHKYNELSNEYQGVELYDTLVEETLTYTNSKALAKIPMKFLIVYIFDKCDIFKKE